MSKNGEHIYGLDGLRGLAVLAVVAFHAGLPVRYGGIVGVMVFFGLSGYLITGILYKEKTRTGRIALKNFYMRRFLRLAPALIASVVMTSVFMVITFDPQLQGNYWWQAFASLTYTMDFFAAAGADMPIWGHTWSLAVEEQFYLVWPLMLLAILALAKTRERAAVAVAWMAVIALLWRLGLWVILGSESFERVYYAPDTVFFAMLFGCALALAPHIAQRIPTSAGYAGLAALIVLCLIPSISFDDTDRIINIYVGTAAGVFVVPVLATASRMKPLAWKPLVFFGTISYGWYLWHQVFLHVQPFGIDVNAVVVKVPLVAAACLVSWLSFKYMEKPIQKRFKSRYESKQKPEVRAVLQDTRGGIES